MSAPVCSCGEVSVFALLRPTERQCTSVDFTCAMCIRSRPGALVPLAEVASVLPELGAEDRTRGAAVRLAAALVNGERMTHVRRLASRRGAEYAV